MEPLTEPKSTAGPFPFVLQDWEQTPPAVQAYVHTLHDELARKRSQGGLSCNPQFFKCL